MVRGGVRVYLLAAKIPDAERVRGNLYLCGIRIPVPGQAGDGERGCAEFSGKDISRYFEETGHLLWWYQWREWFDQVRSLVLRSIEGTDAELATMQELHKAMNYIREHMDRDITLEELLWLTGMSKSHFSRKLLH